jgi:hypothetical protein
MHAAAEELVQRANINGTVSKSDLETFMKTDKNRFSLAKSEIIRIELSKLKSTSRDFPLVRLAILTNKEEIEWDAEGLTIPRKRIGFSSFEDYENTLRPVFGDKLSVKK